MGTVIARLTSVATLVISFSAPAYHQDTGGMKAAGVRSRPGVSKVTCTINGQSHSVTLLPTDPTRLSFKNHLEAEQVVKDVLVAAAEYATVLEVKPADPERVDNAELCPSDSAKYGFYLLYNPGWFKELYQGTTEKWADRTVFAHEIAHYKHGDWKNQHDRLEDMEIKADELAGEILAKMKAPWEEIEKVYRSPKMASSLHSDHGTINQRVVAAKKGWESVKLKFLRSYNRGMESLNNREYQNAIGDFDDALGSLDDPTCLRLAAILQPQAEAYREVGRSIWIGNLERIGQFDASKSVVERLLGKCEGAERFDAAIPGILELARATRAEVCVLAAKSYPPEERQDRARYLMQALQDYSDVLDKKRCEATQQCKAIDIERYLARALVLIQVEKYEEAITDCSTAIRLNDQIAKQSSEPTNKEYLADAYYYRSIARRRLGQRTESEKDRKTADEISPHPRKPID